MHFTLDKDDDGEDDDDDDEDNIESNLLNDCASDPRKTFLVNGYTVLFAPNGGIVASHFTHSSRSSESYLFSWASLFWTNRFALYEESS